MLSILLQNGFRRKYNRHISSCGERIVERRLRIRMRAQLLLREVSPHSLVCLLPRFASPLLLHLLVEGLELTVEQPIAMLSGRRNG